MNARWRTKWLALVPLVGLVAALACHDETVAPRTIAPADVQLAVLSSGIPGAPAYGFDGGPVHGAIFTTLPLGQAVNANVQYPQKIDVYLDGGPRNPNSLAAGLNDGLYVFQITDPSGKFLLSQDPARCRVVLVAGGVIQGTVAASSIDGLPSTKNGQAVTDNYSESNGAKACHVDNDLNRDALGANPAGQHDTNVDSDQGGGYTVQMMPFSDTPNPGGVYKAWITPLAVYVDKAGGLAHLNDVPSQIGGNRQNPLFAPDLGFKNPSRNNVKTDNFKVRAVPPFIQITKNVDGVAVTRWHVTVFELLAGDWNGKGWTDALPATFAVPLGTDLLACESVPAGYAFVSATVGGSAGVIATALNTTPPPPTLDDQTPPNPVVCVQVPQIANATTIAVAFNNRTLHPRAKISISPLTATNEIGTPHVLTAKVQIDHDLGAGWENAPDGLPIAFAIKSGPGSLTPASCVTGGGTGACSTTLTSSTAGTTVVEASSSPNVDGTVIPVKTDGTGSNSGPASKYWVDANIAISPNGLNPVGAPHTFGVTFTAVPGAATPVAFNSITVTLSSTTLVNPTDYWVVSETCSNTANWGGSGNTRTCQVVINANKAGVIKAHAAGSVTMGADQGIGGVGTTVLRETNGVAPNSGDAVKTYFQPNGCTPGFWKQDQHFGYWVPSGYSPVATLSKVSAAFGHFTGQGGATDGYDANLTLLGALGLDNSNGIGQVLRHGTAALLNASSPGVQYGIPTPQGVKDLVNAALDAYGAGNQAFVDQAHATLASYNQLNCPLSGQLYYPQ